jgi:hypothetical protein
MICQEYARILYRMNSSSRLQVAFEDYLGSDLDEKSAQSLADELAAIGLCQEAESMRCLLEGKGSFVVQDGPWQGCNCSVALTPPIFPQPGNLWFDSVELTTMSYVEELPGWSSHSRGWMSIRPVQRWQFGAFLQIAQPKCQFDGDGFSIERFGSGEPLEPVVDLYPDEAEAYALWFGKWSVGDLDLICADRILTPGRKEMLSPNELLLWDLSPSSGWNYGVGFRNQTGALIKVEFSDCDRDPGVGFATFASLDSPRMSGWKRS